MSLEKSVAAKLAVMAGQEEASALWKELWAAYAGGEQEGAEAFLDGLLDAPDAPDEAADEGEEDAR